MDCFAALGVPRRPWLDPELLKEKFHALTASHHPDVNRTGEVEFANINAAYQTLRDPVRLLRHLLELEHLELPTGQTALPAPLVELFMRIGETRARLGGFLAKQAQASSPLAQALLAPDKFSLTHELQQQLALMEEKQAAILRDVQSLEVAWDPADDRAAEQLANLSHGLSFISKWSEQHREALMKLTG